MLAYKERENEMLKQTNFKKLTNRYITDFHPRVEELKRENLNSRPTPTYNNIVQGI